MSSVLQLSNRAYPNQTFTGWIPSASSVSKLPILSATGGKHVNVTGRIETVTGAQNQANTLGALISFAYASGRRALPAVRIDLRRALKPPPSLPITLKDDRMSGCVRVSRK
jgi:hypothetical protein